MKKPWRMMIWLIPVALLTYSFFMFQRAVRPPLPPFHLLMLDSVTDLNTNDIPKGRPSILVFFSPDCDHCQKETESILHHMDSLGEVNFYFITVDPFNRMQLFNSVYKLHQYPNITVGRDYTFFFPWHFKGAQPPYTVIYDKHKRLKAILPKETNAGELRAWLNKP